MKKYKQIDEKIVKGYKLVTHGQESIACDTWLDAWEDIKGIMAKERIKDLPALEQAYRWSVFLMDFVQDIEEGLYNAALGEPWYFSKRIKYCEELLKLCGDEDGLLIENMRRAIAESHFALGNKEECDSLFGIWLSNDPAWGWGYIGWADCYHDGAKGIAADDIKAERIIRRALDEANLRDRGDVTERAIEIYTALGKEKEAAILRGELKKPAIAQKSKTKISSSAASVKVGRNDPCPCGSGKKYKKCCGR